MTAATQPVLMLKDASDNESAGGKALNLGKLIRAGFNVPDDRTIDGVDQTELLLGKSPKGRKSFLYNRNAIRRGKWKYLRARHRIPGYAVDRQRKEVEELYDLDADIGERVNLAAKHPEKVAELKALMQTITEQI